jgi:hypothetical protein
MTIPSFHDHAVYTSSCRDSVLLCTFVFFCALFPCWGVEDYTSQLNVRSFDLSATVPCLLVPATEVVVAKDSSTHLEANRLAATLKRGGHATLSMLIKARATLCQRGQAMSNIKRLQDHELQDHITHLLASETATTSWPISVRLSLVERAATKAVGELRMDAFLECILPFSTVVGGVDDFDPRQPRLLPLVAEICEADTFFNNLLSELDGGEDDAPEEPETASVAGDSIATRSTKPTPVKTLKMTMLILEDVDDIGLGVSTRKANTKIEGSDGSAVALGTMPTFGDVALLHR